MEGCSICYMVFGGVRCCGGVGACCLTWQMIREIDGRMAKVCEYSSRQDKMLWITVGERKEGCQHQLFIIV